MSRLVGKWGVSEQGDEMSPRDQLKPDPSPLQQYLGDRLATMRDADGTTRFVGHRCNRINAERLVDRRHDVDVGRQGIGTRIRADDAGPTHDERNPHAAFVDGAFALGEGVIGVPTGGASPWPARSRPVSGRVAAWGA